MNLGPSKAQVCNALQDPRSWSWQVQPFPSDSTALVLVTKGFATLKRLNLVYSGSELGPTRCVFGAFMFFLGQDFGRFLISVGKQ